MSVSREIATTVTWSARGRGLFGRLVGSRGMPGTAVQPPIGRGERVLVEDVDDGDRMVAATTHALYRQPATDEEHDWRRWGWETVGRVDWEATRRALTLHPLTEPRSATAVLRLRRGDRLAAFAAERVAAGKLLDTMVLLDDGRRARVIGRCRPGSPEPLWIVSVAGAPAEPPSDEAVTAAIAALRRQHGL
jgi:hypothetical protein